MGRRNAPDELNARLRELPSVTRLAAAIEACATTLRFATGQVIVVDGGRAL